MIDPLKIAKKAPNNKLNDFSMLQTFYALNRKLKGRKKWINGIEKYHKRFMSPTTRKKCQRIYLSRYFLIKRMNKFFIGNKGQTERYGIEKFSNGINFINFTQFWIERNFCGLLCK